VKKKDARKTTDGDRKLTRSGLEAGDNLNLLTDAPSRGVTALPVGLVRGRVVVVLQSSVAGGSGGAHHGQDRRAVHGHRVQERPGGKLSCEEGISVANALL
jgi:hypothetical protein